MVVHYCGNVERASFKQRLDTERTDRAMYVQDVGSDMAQRFLESTPPESCSWR